MQRIWHIGKDLLEGWLMKYAPSLHVRLRRWVFRQKYVRIMAAESPLAQGKTHRDIFSDIYSRHVWGRNSEHPAGLCSGVGSYGLHAKKYVDFVREFIGQHNIQSITDIGCGDFNIGRQLIAGLSVRYVGVDVSKEVIHYNSAHFGNEQTTFVCLDATEERAPVADLLLIREVLQHLSNAAIAGLIARHFDSGFKYILVTERQLKPAYLLSPNVDKHSGHNTRYFFGSGVYLDKPPFGLSWAPLLRVDADMGEIITYRITPNTD